MTFQTVETFTVSELSIFCRGTYIPVAGRVWTRVTRETTVATMHIVSMVEPIVIGIVLGLISVTIAGLFVAAIGFWSLSARVVVFGGILVSSVV